MENQLKAQKCQILPQVKSNLGLSKIAIKLLKAERKQAYQSAERKSGTSAEALKRQVEEALLLEKNETDWGDNIDETNDIVVSLYLLSGLPLVSQFLIVENPETMIIVFLRIRCSDRRFSCVFLFNRKINKFDLHHLF